MDHPFTIESDEAFALASELAALTGESVTAAVTAALRERLERKREKAERLARVLARAAKIRAEFPELIGTSDHSDLYDDDGLPV